MKEKYRAFLFGLVEENGPDARMREAEEEK